MLLVCVLVCSGFANAQAARPAKPCLRVAFEGQARAGERFSRSIGGGLEFVLTPRLGSDTTGWTIGILPAGRADEDYSEAATPPFQSVNPRLLTTDYSFRAQDAIAWNPRRFQFVSNPPDYEHATNALHALLVARAGDSSSSVIAAGQWLIRLPGHSSLGELKILDAHLIPGTANQTPAAALLASNLSLTPHLFDQVQPGRKSALGVLEWIRFAVVLWLPADWRVPRPLAAQRADCER